jgi:hypothetical protein
MQIGQVEMMVPVECPACHRIADAVTVVGPDAIRVPEPDDAVICAYCHAVQIVIAPGVVRLATSEECSELPELAKHIIQREPWLAQKRSGPD